MDRSNRIQIPLYLLQKIDYELQEFFHKVLCKTNMDGLKNFFSKTPENIQSSLNSTKFNPSRNAACVFKYGPCYTSAVAKHLLKTLDSNPFLFSDAISRRCLKLCCLGNSMGSEVVAITNILAAMENEVSESFQPLSLKVTMVNSNRSWNKTFEKVVETLTCMFDTSKIKIIYNFVEADMTQPLTLTVKKTLRDVDIVTMVKFISTMKKQLPTTDLHPLIKDITEGMQYNAILFYLDTGVNQQWKILHNILKFKRHFKWIYGPVQLDPHMLTMRSIRKNFELYWEILNSNYCTSSSVVNCCTIFKSDLVEASDSRFSVSANETSCELLLNCNDFFAKQKTLCQKTMDDFHQQIHQALFSKKKKIYMQKLVKKSEQNDYYQFGCESDKSVLSAKLKSKKTK